MARDDTAATPASVIDANSSSMYEAVESLKERMNLVFSEYENEGSYARLTGDLGYIRDRADALQTASIQIAGALEQNL